MGRYLGELMQLADRMGTQHWLLVLAAVIVVGIVCLRGFGSRSGY